MAMKIDAKVVGLRKQLRRLRDVGEQGERAMRDVIDETADAIIREARANLATNDTIASGELAAGFRKIGPREDVQGFNARVINEAPHAMFVEFGTKARGAASAKPAATEDARQRAGYTYGLGISPLPPLQAIRDWAVLRGIPDTAVYPIARRIAEEGVEAQPFFYPALENQREEARRRAVKALRKIARRAK